MSSIKLNRHCLIQAASATGGLALAGSGAFAMARSQGRSAYAEAAEATWQPARPLSGHADALRELVRCATLAANSHNTQPWHFQASCGEIQVAPDFARRCPAVDLDDHHLSISLGCAAENIV
jgi:hypothetical protein